MKALRLLLLLGALLPLLTACLNEDSVDGPVNMTLYDIVTFEGNNPDGGSNFEYLPQGDGPTAFYHAPTALDENEYAPGSRIVIAYNMSGNAEPHTSGDIVLRGVSSINSSDVTLMAHDELPDWSHSPVYLISIWRTGPYINVRSRLTWTEKPRVFGLVADNATINSGNVRAYLVHILPDGLTPADSYDRANYASFNISALLDNPAVKSVTVSVNNSNITALTDFTFDLPPR